jgi:hypothetical protein
MASVFQAGKSSAVLVGTVSQSLKSWTWTVDSKMLEVSNFNSAGYRQYIAGLLGSTVDLSGDYDIGPVSSGGNLALTVGNSYTFTLEANSGLTWVVTGLVANATPKAEVDGTVSISIKVQVTGTFPPTMT